MGSFVRCSSKAAVVIIVSLTLVASAACSSKDSTSTGGSGSPDATTNTAALGAENKATGTPIKIGFVNDGKTDAIDASSDVAVFNATVEYANNYLGGLNGHVIEVISCDTKNTPAGATQCAVQMVNDKVAAALVPVSGQDGSIFNGLEGSGIPYFTYTAANQDIIVKPGAYLLTNPIALIAAPAKIANDKGYDKAGFIIIDVPAATGPITAIANPIYSKAGVDLDIVPISAQTADMTPQIQQAISGGDQIFSIAGTDEFTATAIKTLQQLGFEGDIVIGGQVSQTLLDGVPDGLAGLTLNTTVTADPSDKDVQLYDAVVATYAKDVTPNAVAPNYFATVLAFVNGLTGVTSAVDAASITAALSAMPEAVELPMGGGITFKCGSKPVSFAPNICSASILSATLNEQGTGEDYQLLDLSSYMSLG